MVEINGKIITHEENKKCIQIFGLISLRNETSRRKCRREYKIRKESWITRLSEYEGIVLPQDKIKQWTSVVGVRMEEGE